MVTNGHTCVRIRSQASPGGVEGSWSAAPTRTFIVYTGKKEENGLRHFSAAWRSSSLVRSSGCTGGQHQQLRGLDEARMLLLLLKRQDGPAVLCPI